MKFRWKLLILLLCIATAPIVFARFFGVRAVRDLGSELTTMLSQQHLERTERRLQTLVNGYSKVLQADRERIELVLEHRRNYLEQALFASPEKLSPVFFVEDFKQHDNPPIGMTPVKRYAREGSTRSGHQLEVSFQTPVFHLAPDIVEATLSDDLKRIAGNLTLHKNERVFHQNSILWMTVTLEKGITAIFPGTGSIPMGLDFRDQDWYRIAKKDDPVRWSPKFIDPITRQTVVAISLPIRNPENLFIGAVSLVIPVSHFLEYEFLMGNNLDDTLAFMCRLETGSQGKKSGILIMAREEEKKEVRRRWRTQMEEEWLFTGSSSGFVELRRVLENESGAGGTLALPFDGQDCLYVCSPLNSLNGFLLLITPIDSIMKPAHKAEEHIEDMIGQMISVTGIAIIGMFLVVFLLAIAFSLTVTRPLQALLDASLRLSRGDFDVSVNITSHDEFGDLGKVFNNVGPMLAEHSRMSHSLALASEVQQTLLPQEDPQLPGLDIAGTSISCDETGGDYYDYITIPGDSDNVRLVVGDVSGHGIPSTLLMTTARAFIRQRASTAGTPSQIVTDVNREVNRDVESSGRFMTLFFCEINTADQTLCWVRAGHDPALVYDTSSHTFEELVGEGIPIGIFGDTKFEDHTRPIVDGQLIVLGTDGIWECVNRNGDMYGKKRFRNLIRTHSQESSRKIVNKVIEDVAQFRDGAEQEDDVTVVIIRTLPKG